MNSMKIRMEISIVKNLYTHIIDRYYFMVGECVQFLFTSYEGLFRRTSERSKQVSLAIIHNE